MANESIPIRAGRIIKIIRLRRMYPADVMDEVAVKLNSSLTYEEQREAEMWEAAFDLAKSADSVFNLATELAAKGR